VYPGCLQLLLGIIFILSSLGCCSSSETKDMPSTNSDPQETQFAQLREAMVREQIASRGLDNPAVLAAMRKVPRHKFVPKYLQHAAYTDQPLPIGEGQTISQPYIVAFMTQALEPTPEMRVLEIGTGSGYQAAVLAEIVKEVYSVEIICSLAKSAEQRLKNLGYKNIWVKCADGYRGWEEHAPYDGIIVTAAPDHIPQPLIDQLAVGGRLVIPVGDFYQELVLVTKTKTGLEKKNLLPVRFVPLTGEAQHQPSP